MKNAVNKRSTDKTREIEEILKEMVEEIHESDEYWEKKYGEIPYWKVFSPKILSLLSQSQEELLGEIEKMELNEWGITKDAEYQNGRVFGYNKALSDVRKLIQSL